MPAGIGHIAETHIISPEARCRVFARWRSVGSKSKEKSAVVSPVLRARAARGRAPHSPKRKRSSREKSSTVRDLT
jgi:hypothetical protein